jgi:hypothetical protein
MNDNAPTGGTNGTNQLKATSFQPPRNCVEGRHDWQRGFPKEPQHIATVASAEDFEFMLQKDHVDALFREPIEGLSPSP